MIVRRHGHYSPHIVFVIEGELWVGDRRCPAGTHIELPFGAAFGPLRAGDDGAVLFEVMLGDPRSWGDQPELFEQALADHGAEALPDVAARLPRLARRTCATTGSAPTDRSRRPTDRTDPRRSDPMTITADRTRRHHAGRGGPAADHLGRRPHPRAPHAVAGASCPPAVRDRGPKVVREKLSLHFSGGHYGFTRDDARRAVVRPLALRRPRAAHRAAARGRRRAQGGAGERPRDLRGLPRGDLRPEGPPRRHGHEPRRGRDQLPEHVPALRRARASPSAPTRTSASRASRSTTTG